MLRYCLLIFIFSLLAAPISRAQNNSHLWGGLHLQTIETDLDFEGVIRETKFNSIDIVIREQLTARVDGAFLIGYLDVVQNGNPIFAGQNTGGGYFGFDIRPHLITLDRFQLLLRLDYRYNFTDAEIDDQKIEWEWHHAGIGLHSRAWLTSNFSLQFGAFSHIINGVEKAVGPVNQALDFEAKDSLTGHIGLQLELDRDGQIGMDIITGSWQGGRISFQRRF